jgi:hypothetical protein
MRKEIAARLPESRVHAEKVNRYRVSSNAAFTKDGPDGHGLHVGKVEVPAALTGLTRFTGRNLEC